jgi:hypothetical protein
VNRCKPSLAERKRRAEADRLWHAAMLAKGGKLQRKTKENASWNMQVFDMMPREVRDGINDLGEYAPRWMDDWYELGRDPGHRKK